MQLNLSESQTMLQDTVHRLLKDEATPERIRAAEKEGLDRGLWDKLVELGIATMRNPAVADGGMSLMDAAIVAGEAGRFVAPVPLVEAMVAGGLLNRAGAPQDLLNKIEGGAIAAIALTPVAGSGDSASGEQPVMAAPKAEIIVALVGDELIALTDFDAAMAPNIASMALAMIDPATIAATRHVLASGEKAASLFAAAREEWNVLTAAYLAGLGRRALEMAAEYSCERFAYGAPIGSYQGIAHPMADAATDIDGARLMAWRAITSIASKDARAGARSAMSYWWAAHVIDRAVQHALRTFGGYGLSMEYDIQLYFRRAKLLALVGGDPDRVLDTVAARLWNNERTSLPEAGDVEIDFDWSEEALAYAAELRAFIDENMTPEIEAHKHHSTAGHHPEFHRKLAAAGHAFPDLGAEGQKVRTRYEVMAAAPVWEDIGWTRTPVAVSEFVAKMAQLWCEPEVREEIVGAIARGEALGALGFSEPQAGSDVFGAKFNAVRDGDDWIMNGQKMFTTNGHQADYILMLTRTDNSGKKHQGLTMFIMPMKAEGIELHPVHTLQDEKTNITYFTDVRVPDRYRIGEVGDGARVMASALGFEHGGSGYHAAQTAMMRRALAWARKDRDNAGPPIADPFVRRVLARAAVNDEVAEVLCRRQVWADVAGIHDLSYGPMAKLFTTETMYDDGTAIVNVAGADALVRGLDPDLDFVETTMRRAIAMTVYGGTSEVHRSLIAEKSLGMPRSRG